MFASPAAGAGASDSIGSIGGGGDGETGEVGDLFADMSGNFGDPSASKRGSADDQGEDGGDGGGGGSGSGGDGGGDGDEGNSQHTAMNIDAVMAAFGQDGGEEDASGSAEDRDNDRHTAVNMGDVVAELGRQSTGGGGGRPKRRETADKDGLESLFGSSVGSPESSSAGFDCAESPGSGTAAGGDGDGREADGRRGFEDATAEVPGSWSAIMDTPEPATHHHKNKRRETADASNLQGLLSDSPEGAVPSPSPSPVAGTAARAAGAGDPSSSGADPRQQQQGYASTEPEPSPLGAVTASAAAAAVAVATPGSERSSATAVSMKGMLELASPPGAPSGVRDAGAAEGEQQQQHGGGAVVVTTPRQDGRFGSSQDDGGRDSGRTAGNGSVLGLLDSTPSPGGGLDQSVADGSALRGRTLARMYDSSSAGGSSVSEAKDTVSQRAGCGRVFFGAWSF